MEREGAKLPATEEVLKDSGQDRGTNMVQPGMEDVVEPPEEKHNSQRDNK